GPHDAADLFKVSVKEVLLMMGKTPFRKNRSTAADDAGSSLHRPRDVAQKHARMDREIIDALFGLFDQRVAIHFPGHFFGAASRLFESLIDRHGPDRNRGVTQNPLSGLVDIAAR